MRNASLTISAFSTDPGLLEVLDIRHTSSVNNTDIVSDSPNTSPSANWTSETSPRYPWGSDDSTSWPEFRRAETPYSRKEDFDME